MQPVPRAAGAAARAGLEGKGDVAPRRAQRGDEPREERRRDREGEREGGHARVDGDLVESREPGGSPPRQEGDAGAGEQQAEEPRGRRDRGGLDEPLPDEPAAARAERRAHRRLLLAREPLREQQVRHVGAGDEQHEGDRPGEEEQRRPRAAHDRLLEGLDRHRGGGVRAGPLRGEPPRHHVHLGAGLRERRARPQPAEDAQEAVVAPLLLRAEDERDPQLRAGRPERGEPEPARHDRRDDVAAPVEREGLADDRRVGAEPARPEGVAQHDLVPRAALAEGAAERRRDAEEVEEGRRRLERGQLLRRAAPRQDRGPRVRGGHRLERSARALPLLEVRRRGRVARLALLRLVLEEGDEARGVAVSERPEQHVVDDAEDGARRADADGERQDGDQRHSRRAPEPSCGLRHLRPERVHHLRISFTGRPPLPEPPRRSAAAPSARRPRSTRRAGARSFGRTRRSSPSASPARWSCPRRSASGTAP